MFVIKWIILRLSVLFLLFGLFLDIEIMILILGFLIFHIKTGVSTIVYDYIHITKIKFVSLSLIRILSIEISKYSIELFL